MTDKIAAKLKRLRSSRPDSWDNLDRHCRALLAIAEAAVKEMRSFILNDDRPWMSANDVNDVYDGFDTRIDAALTALGDLPDE